MDGAAILPSLVVYASFFEYTLIIVLSKHTTTHVPGHERVTHTSPAARVFILGSTQDRLLY